MVLVGNQNVPPSLVVEACLLRVVIVGTWRKDGLLTSSCALEKIKYLRFSAHALCVPQTLRNCRTPPRAETHTLAATVSCAPGKSMSWGLYLYSLTLQSTSLFKTVAAVILQRHSLTISQGISLTEWCLSSSLLQNENPNSLAWSLQAS